MATKLQSNLDAGAIVVAPTEWSDVLALAEQISSRHTLRGGHRYVDILHVAMALHPGVSEFLPPRPKPACWGWRCPGIFQKSFPAGTQSRSLFA